MNAPAAEPDADAAAAFAAAEAAIRAVLPPGSAMWHEPGDVAPEERCWLIHAGARFVGLIPQNIAAPALRPVTDLQRALRGGRLPDGAAVRTVALLMPPQARWPAAPALSAEARPVLLARPQKIVAFPIDAASGAVLGAIKRPKSAIPLRHCRAEFALLADLAAAGSRAGPLPRSMSAREDAFHYEFIAGDLPRETPARVFTAFVRALEDGSETTPREQAVRCAAKVEALDIDAARKAALLRLLARVQDATPIRRGIAHGDFKPGNLVVDAEGRLRAIDWESAQRDGIPLFDLVRLSFTETLHARTATTLRALFSGPGRDRLHAFLDDLFPRARPDVADLLHLFFCARYVERIEHAGGRDTVFLRFVTAILLDTEPL